MADKDLELKITTPADTTGAEKATAALNESAKAAGNDANATQEQTKATGFLNLKKGELKKLTRELAHSFPELGMAIRFAMNPVVATLTVAIGVFVKIKQSIEETNKALDEQAERAAKGFGNMGAAIQDAKREIAFASNEITTHLKKIADTEKDIQTRTDDATAALRRQEQAQIALTDAQEAYELAFVDSQRKLHEVDPKSGYDDVTALKLEAAIKASAAQRRVQIQNTTDQKAITEKEGQLKGAGGEEAQLKAVFAPLEKNREMREARLKDLPDVIKEFDDRIEQSKKDIKAQQDVVENAKHNLDKVNNLGPLGALDKGHYENKLKEEQEKLERFRSELTTQKTGSNQAKDEQARLTLEKKNYEDVKAALEKTRDIIKDITREVTNLKHAADDNAKLRGQQTAIGRATESTKTNAEIFSRISKTPQGQDIERAAGIERLKEHHEKVSDTDEAFYKDWLSKMQANHTYTQGVQSQLINLLSVIANGSAELSARVRALERVVEMQKGQMGYMRLNVSG